MPDFRRIDVHAHYFGGSVGAGFTAATGGAAALPPWSVDEALSFMDRHEIDLQILSVPMPMSALTSAHRADAGLARAVNEELAEIVNAHPGRFGAFGYLPLPDFDAALAEIDYCLDSLRLDGIGLLSNVDGVYFGAPELDPIFDELERRAVAVFVHPADPPGVRELALGRRPSVVEWVFETARTITNFVYTGGLARHDELRLILSHGGGALPAIAWRVANSMFQRGPGDAALEPAAIFDQLRRLYYDTALAASPSSLLPLLEVTSPDHILFGTDRPPVTDELARANLEYLLAADGLSAEEVRAIQIDNFRPLFRPLFDRLFDSGSSSTATPRRSPDTPA